MYFYISNPFTKLLVRGTNGVGVGCDGAGMEDDVNVDDDFVTKLASVDDSIIIERSSAD